MTPAGLLQRRAWTISLALLGLLLAMEFTQLDVALARVYFDPARRDFPLREVWFTTTVSHDAMRLAAGAALAWVALSPWLPLGFLRRLDRRARFYLLASTAASLIVVTGLKRLSYSFLPVGPGGVRRPRAVAAGARMAGGRHGARALPSRGTRGGGERVPRRLLRLPAGLAPDCAHLAGGRARADGVDRTGTAGTRRALPQPHAVDGLVVLDPFHRAGRMLAFAGSLRARTGRRAVMVHPGAPDQSAPLRGTGAAAGAARGSSTTAIATRISTSAT
jgi:hypothetical protein